MKHMTITKREGKRHGGRFMVSVPEETMKDLESAINYLIDKRQLAYSAILIALIFTAAKRAGWTPET